MLFFIISTLWCNKLLHLYFPLVNKVTQKYDLLSIFDSTIEVLHLIRACTILILMFQVVFALYTKSCSVTQVEVSDRVIQLCSDWSSLTEWLSIGQITITWVKDVFVSSYCLSCYVKLIWQCLTKMSGRLKCHSIKIIRSYYSNVWIFF